MATDIVKQIRRKTRRKFSADEKIRIVLERVANSVSEKIDAGTDVSSDWSRGFPSLSLRYRL